MLYQYKTPETAYIQSHRKSYLTGIVLTLFFGPLGLFYSSVTAAIIMCVIAVVTCATIVGPIAVWGLSILFSLLTISSHNNRVETFAGLTKGKTSSEDDRASCQ